jgi:hypothetical protein
MAQINWHNHILCPVKVNSQAARVNQFWAGESRKLYCEGRKYGAMEKIAFSYFIRDHLLVMGRQVSLSLFSILQLRKTQCNNRKGRLKLSHCTCHKSIPS